MSVRGLQLVLVVSHLVVKKGKSDREVHPDKLGCDTFCRGGGIDRKKMCMLFLDCGS